MILEGIVTTVDERGEVHVAPMGPLVDEDFSGLVLRPFQTSTTYANLKRTGAGVFHVTDDVELMARAAVGRLERNPEVRRAETIEGFVLADACRWYEFRVRSLDDREPRTRIECVVQQTGRGRDFLGFNRANHAVIEAAILATRLHLLDAQTVRDELQRLSVIVDKTAGSQQRRAFDFLRSYVAEQHP